MLRRSRLLLATQFSLSLFLPLLQGWTVTISIWEFLMSALFGFDFAWLLWLLLFVGYISLRLWRRANGWGLWLLRRKKNVLLSSGGLRDLDV